MTSPTRTAIAILVLACAGAALSGCGRPRGADDGRDMAAHPTTVPSDALPNLKLKLAWNGQTYDVPPPAVVPPEMRATKRYAQWWRTGDIRNLEWTDAEGRRYVAEAWARGTDEHGVTQPIIPFVSRFRPDGTLEVKTEQMPGLVPTTWTHYAADGKTKLVEVQNRTSGIEGVPFIQYVTFFDPAGVKTRRYQANRYGVAYLEWFYSPDGQVARWNGSGKLDKPL
jgi:hypothetical protein